MAKQHLLLWLDKADLYRDALAAEGLLDAVEVTTVGGAERPDAQALSSANALLAWGVPPDALAGMPRLRWIQTQTAAMDAWLRRPDLRDDIILTSAQGIHRVQMPENILGALLYVTRPFRTALELQRTRQWQRLIAEPLAGKTLGIVGLGTVGQELARKAAALEMRVLGVRRAPEPGATPEGVEAVHSIDGLDDLLRQSDFVVLLLPLTPETEDLFDARRMKAMKDSAWLLNFGRGGSVVDDDLIAAVRGGGIAGAVLDVFRQEPLPAEHPFWTTDGIIVLPHIGGLHPERDRIVADLFVDNVRRFIEQRPMRAVIDRARGY